jgi:hypothetical protein
VLFTCLSLVVIDAPSGAGDVIPQDTKDQLQSVIAETWQ